MGLTVSGKPGGNATLLTYPAEPQIHADYSPMGSFVVVLL